MAICMRQGNSIRANKNKGFSLVELLIAVTILSIIVIPMYRMFVTSTKISVKAKKIQRATTVAQDIMEGLKAYNIDELKEQFTAPANGFYVINDQMIKGNISEDITRESDSTLNGVDPSGDPLSGLYYFAMEEVTMQGNTYDALIEVDARGYMPKPTNASDPRYAHVDKYGTHGAEFNHEGVDKIVSVLDKKDGIYAQDIMVDMTALNQAKNAYSEDVAMTFNMPGYSVDRKILVELKEVSTGLPAPNDKEIASQITYTYNWKKTGGANQSFVIVDKEPCGTVINNKFYLFYYPLYAGAATVTDEIEIDNSNKNIPLDIYLVKQKSNDLTDTQLQIAEQNYRTNVNVKTSNMAKTNIRTNLGYNLQSNAQEVSQVTYKNNGSVVTTPNVFDLTGKQLSGAIVNEDITERIFDIKVSIYQPGAYANGFPDDDLMIAITGNKNN